MKVEVELVGKKLLLNVNKRCVRSVWGKQRNKLRKMTDARDRLFSKQTELAEPISCTANTYVSKTSSKLSASSS